MSGRNEKTEQCPYNDACACAPSKRNCSCCAWYKPEEDEDGEE